MPSGASLALLGSAALGVGGSIISSRNQQDAQRDALSAATTELNPFNVFAPGGQRAQFGNVGPNTFNDPTFAGFQQLANNQFDPAASGTSPSASLPGGAAGPRGGNGFDELNPFLGNGLGVAPRTATLDVGGAASTGIGAPGMFGSIRGGGNPLTGVRPFNPLDGFNPLTAQDASGGGFNPTSLQDLLSQQGVTQGIPFGNTLTPTSFNFTPPLGGTGGPGGGGGGVAGPASTDNTAGFGLGDLEPARGGLVAFANQQLGRAGLGGGLPQNVQNANQLAQLAAANIPQANAQGLQALEGGAGQLAGGAAGQGFDLLQNGFQRGLANQGFGVAGQQLGDVAQSGQQATQQALSTLRGQAQPANERAVQGQLDSLFGSGRLGTTGGANQLGRLAEAQDQQDLGFQRAALGEGRAAQQNALGLASGASNIGSGIAGLEDSLLQSAFGRFGQTAGLAADLNNSRFGRQTAVSEIGNQRAQQNLQNQLQQAGFAQNLQQGDLGLALQALQGQSGLNQQGLNLAQFGLAAGSAQANARIGSGSNIASITNNGDFGGTAGVLGDLGTSLFSGVSRTQGGQDSLGRLFGSLFGGGG